MKDMQVLHDAVSLTWQVMRDDHEGIRLDAYEDGQI